MFDRKTIIIGGFLVVLLLVVSGFLIWQVTDNHSKNLVINNQESELKDLKENYNKNKIEQNNQIVEQIENKVEFNTSSWRENVIDCLNNYPISANTDDYEYSAKELEDIFLNNSYGVVCNRLWHGTKLIENDLTGLVKVNDQGVKLFEGIRFVKDGSLFIEIINDRKSTGYFVKINTQNEKWEIESYSNFPEVQSGNEVYSPDRGKIIYIKYATSTALWVFDFKNNSNKKVYDVPEGYLLTYCGEGSEGFEEVKWLNDETVKLKMGKIISPDLCKDDKGNYVCGECGESFDAKYVKEVILNNL